MADDGFPADHRLTLRVTETWLLLLVITVGSGLAVGLVLYGVLGWPWWVGLGAPLLAAVLVYALDGRSMVLPKGLEVVDVDAGREPDLHAAMDRLCALAGIRPPKLKVIEAQWANALAFKLPWRRPTVAVTRGLLERCDGEQLDAVLAHELAHLAHRDASAMTVAAYLSTSVALVPVLVLAPLMAIESPLCWVARQCGWRWVPASSGEDADAVEVRSAPAGRRVLLTATVMPVVTVLRVALYVVLFGLAIFLVPIMLALMIPGAATAARLGRYRELAADRAASALTGRPAALAAALTALGGEGTAIPRKDLRELSALSAVSIVALPRYVDQDGKPRPPGAVDRVLATHPSLPSRLEQLAGLSRALAER
ncbi:M48 family metalloprotease [Jiangella asiatica]|uniref:Peptidase M48 domain-containing protein n=1 Tax=Jiangella asiatica TaxID=2530372 RepID=A0A4R5CJ15_9ACTN|nr:M48 family metalloprotease [Jiangella asiatica]TDE00259.1 hypothetical protein E1269_25955 [Jiangella asiatica]